MGFTIASISNPEDVFDPKIHLAYDAPARKITMDELRIPGTPTSSPVAGTLPFKLLSHEGVLAYRRSLFNPEVIDHCGVSPLPGTLVMRGPAKYSRFIHDFWTHEETMGIISGAIGVPLSIIMPLEIAHTNIQAKGTNLEEMKASLQPEPSSAKIELSEAEKNYDPLNESSIIPWHFDSYPYVCVLMISNTDGMLGGETYIKGGDGKISKVDGPMMGHACVLQGGEVEHMAARAVGVAERITTITSYRANVPKLYDSSYLANLRPYSRLDELYSEWALYRLEKMKEEVEALQKKIRSSGIDTDEFGVFATQQTEYIQRSAAQLVPMDFHTKTIAKHGSEMYHSSPQIWKAIQEIPEFGSLVMGEKSRAWMPGSLYWTHYHRTVEAIRHGMVLESQQGRAIWLNERPYCMGDELLRQGLREHFLDWLDATGLYDIYLSRNSSLQVR